MITTYENQEWVETGCIYIDRLAMEGDALEHLIIRQAFEPLNQVFIPYSRIWLDHIYPRRKDNGAFLVEEWQDFGGRHYTALIRLHHALYAKNEINRLCEQAILGNDTDYELLLSSHSVCASFWDNIGASIDNLLKAKMEASKALGFNTPKRHSTEFKASSAENKFTGRTLSPVETPKLDYAFQRRNQFIHSIIVPHQFTSGEITFNLRHFDDETTNWSNEVFHRQELSSKIDSDWCDIITEFGRVWGELYNWLQTNDKNRPLNQDLSLKHNHPVSMTFESSSGSVRSNFSPPPPSGSLPLSGNRVDTVE